MKNFQVAGENPAEGTKPRLSDSKESVEEIQETKPMSKSVEKEPNVDTSYPPMSPSTQKKMIEDLLKTPENLPDAVMQAMLDEKLRHQKWEKNFEEMQEKTRISLLRWIFFYVLSCRKLL